jgi:hypothetical protein
MVVASAITIEPCTCAWTVRGLKHKVKCTPAVARLSTVRRWATW